MPMLGYKELYEARERLRNPRARTDLDCVTNVTQTWERYLADIGLQRMTVHRWLEHYEPAKIDGVVCAT